MDEIDIDICGENGKAAKYDLMVSNTNVSFHNLLCEAEKLNWEVNGQRTRAETVVNDFSVVAEMSDEDYEYNMEEARGHVSKLEQIVIDNPYEPMNEKATEEYNEAAALLENVKERFGGGERKGRCHSNRAYKMYDRLQPATKDNFDFQPGDINRLDSNGNRIPDDEWAESQKTFGPDCHIDNSHLTDSGLENFDETLDNPSEDSDDYVEKSYEDYDDDEDDYEEPPFNPIYDNSLKYDESLSNEYDSESVDEEFTIADESATCEAQNRVAAILPSRGVKALAEQYLLHDETNKEVFIGLKAKASVPNDAWRWVSICLRLFNYLL